MSYRELTMTDIKEVLRRWSARQSIHKIARESGIDRKTVRRYVKAAESCVLERGREPSEAEIHEIAQRVQARPLPERSEEGSAIEPYRERIVEWLGRHRPLRVSKIHQLLCRDYGLQVSYHALWRYIRRELGWHKKRPTVRIDDPPAGQEAQVDFGEMGFVVDAQTGARRKLWVLIITLSHSRYQFVWPSFRQTTEAVCEGLDAAWRFFGAMPKTIVPDNMKAIVVSADPLCPRLCAAFADYVQARGIFVDPARVRSPQDKPRVENQVAYVRESWFDGESFTSLEHARQSAEHWSREVAGARVHGTTRQVPREIFESVEKTAMLPPPSEPFDVPTWTQAKVHPDHHIQVSRALYSVPTRYLHKTVRVRTDRCTVRIYLGTEVIKVHPRQHPGGRSTDPNDYPIGKAAYALRSVEGILLKAQQRGSHIGIYAEKILAGPLPWARMRQGYALLSLCEKYGDGRVEAVCQSALAFDVIDVARIGRMLKTAMRPGTPQATDAKLVSITTPRFARAQRHFQTRNKEESR
jgi:transposase